MDPGWTNGSHPEGDRRPGRSEETPGARQHYLRIRIADDLYWLLKLRAREQHRSMQGQVLRLIETDVRRAKTKEA